MDRREIWCRHSWSPEESLLVIIWLVFLYYWVKYLRTGKIDRHKISWKHLWLSDDVSWWLCWSPGPKRCFQAVLLSTRSPSTSWHWEMLWLNTQKKLFERKNDELKVKQSRADKLKLALTGSFTTSSVLTGRCCPMFYFSPASGNNDMRDDSVLLNRSPSHVRQPQGEANAVCWSSSSQ